MQKRKRIIKTAAVCLSAVLMLTATVSAQTTEIKAEYKDNKVTITHNVPAGGNGTFLYVFDTVVKEDDTITESFIKEHLVYVSLNNEQSFEFILPEETPYGVYTVMLASANLQADKSGKIAYMIKVDADELAVAMEVINSSSSADELATNIGVYNGSMYFVDSDYIASKKDTIYDVFAAGVPEGGLSDSSDIDTLIKKAEIVEKFHSMSAEMLDAAISENPDLFVTNEDYEKYNEEISNLLNALINGPEMVSVKTVKEINDAIYEATAVSLYNNVPAGEILDVVERHNDVFKVDLTDSKYKQISKTELAKLLDYETIKRAADLEPIFDEAVKTLYDEMKEKENKKPVGGGGGGGRAAVGTPSNAPVTLDEETLSDIRGEEYGFSDVEGFEWANEAINELNGRGIMTGDGDGRFRPDDAIKREEFVKIIVEGFKINPDNQKSDFSDVEEGSWYEPYVVVASEMDIVNGLSETEFGTGTNITRQDAAVILYRAITETETKLNKVHTLIDFTDFKDVSDYAREAIDSLARCGILNGFEDGSFRPSASITRAEAAKILYECIRNL